MKYINPIIVVLITFIVLLINFNWGLPTSNRSDLVFEDKTELNKNIQGIVAVKEKIGRFKENKRIPGHILDRDELLHQAVREFLLIPYAGDDYITLSTIKNLNPYKLQFDPKHYIYGGGLIYTGAVFLQAAEWLGYVKLIPDEAYYMKNPQEIGKLYTVLRFMIILFAVVGINLVYHLARKLFGERIALLSWVIILATPVTHQASHTIEPHIFALPLFMISFLFTVKSINGNSKQIRRCYVVSAIFAGISIGTQSTSLYIVFPFFASLVINYKNKNVKAKNVYKYILMYIIISIGSCLLLNPFYLLNYEGFFSDINSGTGSVFYQNIHFWLPYQITWFLLLLFTITIIFHLIKCRNDYYVMLSLSCIIPGILVYFMTNTLLPYVYSIIPLLAILTAIMLTDVCAGLKGRIKAVMIIVMVVLFLAFPVTRSVYCLRNFTSENRDFAGKWINNNVPKGSTIGVSYPPTNWDCVAFRFFNYNLVDYRKINSGNMEHFPDFVLTVEQLLPESLSNKYSVVKVYKPKSILGYRVVIGGELQSLIAKTIRIYSLNDKSG
jgi:hypothetical protein